MNIVFNKRLDKELLKVGIQPLDILIDENKSVDMVLNDVEFINDLYDKNNIDDLRNFSLELLAERELMRKRLNKLPQSIEVQEKQNELDIVYIDSTDIRTELFKNKEFNVTIPSHSSFLLNSKFNYSLVSMLLKESIKDDETNNRIVYKVDMNGVSIIKRICVKYNLSYNTVKTGINKFIQSGVITEVGKFYMFNIKVDNKYFVEIHSTMLDKIYSYKLKHELSSGDKRRITVDTMLRCLVFMSYKLKNGPASNMSRAYICKSIGLVNKNTGEPTKEHTDKLTCNLKALEKLGAITIFTKIDKKDIDGNISYKKNNTYALGKVKIRK